MCTSQAGYTQHGFRYIHEPFFQQNDRISSIFNVFSSSVLLQHSSSNLEIPNLQSFWGADLFQPIQKNGSKHVFGALSLTGYLVVHVGDSAYSGQISMANSGDRLQPVTLITLPEP